MAPVVEDLRRTLERVYVDRAVRVEVDATPGLAFRGERQDLEEMLGNLIDNACKWAQTRVTVSARAEADRILFTIDDDGPGLPADQRGAVFDRGTRLDESVPGSGLGLAIVRDIAELSHHGAIALEISPRRPAPPLDAAGRGGSLSSRLPQTVHPRESGVQASDGAVALDSCVRGNDI